MDWVKEQGLSLPLGYADEHNVDDRFLREDIIDLFDSFEEIRPLIERGYIYVNGRDKYMRPIIVMNVRKMIDDDVQLDDIVKLVIFNDAYLMCNAFVPGRIEQYAHVIDLSGIALHDLPI